MILGVIPARYASTRLPGKPLLDLCGQSMIERVWRAAKACPMLDRIVIATEDERVIAEAQRFGAEAYLTSADLPSGTDRCDALVRQLHLQPDVVVNIQGDEPLLSPNVITHLVQSLKSSGADVATVMSRILFEQELTNPSVVKLVIDSSSNALYFSRSPIPFLRSADERTAWHTAHTYWKHIGIYAYTLRALQRHVSLPQSPLERAEMLEQLRLLEDGARFMCVETEQLFLAVDTAQDAEHVREVLRSLQK